MDDIDYLGASGSVLSYNLYSYCENNPVNNVDYNGNAITPANIIGAAIGAVLGAVGGYFFMNYAPKFKLNNYSKIVAGFLQVVIKTAIATISSFIAGKIINKISAKSFSSKQIKNYFKNTKYLKSAFGIGSGGKTGRRMWFYDAGITTILYNFLA